MSVGSSNLTGIPQRVAPPPVKATQAAEQNNQANTSAKAALLVGANAPTAPVAPVVAAAAAVSGAPAPAPGGLTTTGRGSAQGNIAPTNLQPGTAAAAMAMASAPALLAAMGAQAITANRGRVKSVSGDAKEDSGDVALETQSEGQVDALQDSNQEQGAGEINEAGTTSGPAT